VQLARVAIACDGHFLGQRQVVRHARQVAQQAPSRVGVVGNAANRMGQDTAVEGVERQREERCECQSGWCAGWERHHETHVTQ
jgi:hypothetical protein